MAGTEGKGHRQTPEVLAQVCDGLRSGLPIKRAAMIAGISEKTFHLWRSAGWGEIERTDEDSDAEMSFVVQFALQAEAAIAEYMRPLIKRIADAALGKGKGDWRAAHAILAGRFPHEFSERVAVAQSQKVEVSGGIGINYQRRLYDRMSLVELQDEIDRLWVQEHAGLSGATLDEKIVQHEGVLASLYKSRDQERAIASLPRGKFSTVPQGGRFGSPPLELGASEFDQDHENNKICAAVLQAPDKVGTVEVVATVPAAPSGPMSFEVQEERPARGIGYDQHGLAFRFDDEDLSL